ncbi:hypothetical protein QJS10_CPA05g01047 [Acorus calamus]|uniref:Uncharacterized protein n=1 Tax=Acorus calamus TaxID=4465 RepID=A0AAV9EUN1_ACOCL|nr:hypothetical protein QJS10_CPA05g01047 [Acorus calamus]
MPISQDLSFGYERWNSNKQESPIARLRVRNKCWMGALIDSLDSSIAEVKETVLTNTIVMDHAEAEFEERDMAVGKALESMMVKALVVRKAKREAWDKEEALNEAKGVTVA